MKKFLLSCLLLAAITTPVFASKLSIQGHLNNNGVSMDGDHPATFTFYDAATNGTSLWTESVTLHVQNSLFTQVLGLTNDIPSAVFAAPAVWLETTVDGTTLTPRVAYYPLTLSVGAGADTLWTSDGTNVWRTGGKVGIGTSNLWSMLQLGNNGSALGLTADQGSPDGAYLRFGDNTGWKFHIARFREGGGLPLNTGTQGEIMTFQDNGWVGVGTTNPNSTFDVAGKISSLGSNNGFCVQSPVSMLNGSPWYGLGTSTNSLTGGSGYPAVQLAGYYGILVQTAGSSIAVRADGNIDVSGNLTVTGTKCRAVEGTKYGTLYFNAVESGNAIFTTSGRAQLENGKAHIDLDPKWLAGVTINNDHPLNVTSVVFYGPHGDWYAKPGHNGFDVIDPSGSSSEFFWTVQASQKGYENRYLDNNDTATTAARE